MVSLALALSCSASTGAGSEASGGFGGLPPGSGAVPGTGGVGGVPSAGGVTSTGGDTGFGAFGGSRGGAGGPQSPDAACEAVSQQAETVVGGKADIIWAIDGSLSMLTETQGVQSNMNTFSDYITKTGIDVHVVLVASGGNLLNFGMCIAPPLGSGQACPNDTNPPRYTHILQDVGSWDSLTQIINTYPQWQSVIRPDSTKTFVVVTDDEVNTTNAADFTNSWNTTWPGQKWRFSGIYCMGPSANCSGIGTTYDQLTKQTGGIWVDMGNPTPDWNAVFKQLGDAILADAKPVDCEWKIPPPPDGKTFDKNQVNVRFTPTSGAAEDLVPMNLPTDCTDATGGWYYDNNDAPANVLSCPSTCTRMRADTKARVEVLFGCARVVGRVQ
jgi:hypothetical protein